jgi:hypothetical protein
MPTAARRIVLSLTGIVLVVLIAYIAYWRYVAGQLRDQLAPWAEAQAAEGYIVHWDRVSVAGFPGPFRFKFDHLALGTARPVPLTATAARAEAWAMPWNLNHWEFTTPNGAQLAEPSNSAGVTTRRLDGTVEVTAGKITAIDVAAIDIAGTGLAEGVAIGDAAAHIELPPRPPQSHTDIAVGLSLQLDQATLPVALPAFGHTLSGLSVAGQVKGALPPGPFTEALARWRDDGGTLELESLRLRWGALLIDASGTLALDRALQPEGAFSAVITGQDSAVDVAVMSGALKPGEAGAAKALFGLLAKPKADGQEALTLPMTIENQQLYLGPAKLGAIPTIPWK